MTPYRYTLDREWVVGAGRVLWIMLNPSTADAVTDDPTIRRCIGFSQAWGFAALRVVNLFALRATDPQALRIHPQVFNQSEHMRVVGPYNDESIELEARRADLIVAAWGNHGSLYSRDEEVRELLTGAPLHHLGLTKMNQPRHPLYVPRTAAPIPWDATFRAPVSVGASAAPHQEKLT